MQITKQNKKRKSNSFVSTTLAIKRANSRVKKSWTEGDLSLLPVWLSEAKKLRILRML
jgi:hypothetical protein